MKSRRAFTLVEVMVVIAVIGILAAVLILLLPGAINDAIAKSAISDARNAVTTYKNYSDKSESDLVLTVEKGGKFYAFGFYFNLGVLAEYKHNPIELNTHDEVYSMLITNDCISENAKRMDDFGDIPESTVVYEGCLYSITKSVQLSEDVLNMRLGERHSIDVTVNSVAGNVYGNVEWTTTDEAVATVENGEVIAKGNGSTEIFAVCDGVESTRCTVNVNGVVKTDDIEVLKAEVENTAYNASFIELIGDISSSDKSLFPIVIPKNKYVEIKLHDFSIGYKSEVSESDISAMFENSGGNISIIGDSEAESKLEIKGAGDTVSAVLIGNTSGTVTIGNCKLSMQYIGFDPSTSYVHRVIDNRGKMRLENCILDYDNSAYDGTDITEFADIYNSEAGKISILGCRISNSAFLTGYSNNGIINDGEIEALSDTYFIEGTGLINRGKIDSIANCSFSLDGAYENRVNGFIRVVGNKAVVDEIVDCIFDATRDEVVEDDALAISVTKGGCIRKISGCEFHVGNEVFCDSSSSVER